MLNFATFETYLNADITLRPITTGLIADPKPDLRQWAANLSMQSESEQYTALEKLLSELVVAQMSDSERLSWLQHILPSVKRLIGQLHQHYIYELSALTEMQLRQVDQVKSLEYMLALIYEGIIRRQLKSEPKLSTSPLAKLRLRQHSNVNQELFIALAGGLMVYLNLLMEDSLCYKRPPLVYWQKLNEYYRQALSLRCQKEPLPKFFTEIDTQMTLKDIFCEASLHSLLGLSSYRRQDIIGLHKLLPVWAKQITLTHEPKPEYRLFIDLDSNRPPQHLTPHTEINPFEEDKNCVFLDLTDFELYLDNITNQYQKNAKTSHQLRLAKMAWHTLTIQTGRHEERHVCYDRATVVSGFNLIHFYMAGKKSLSSVINANKIEVNYLPNYDTNPKSGYSKQNLAVQIMDTSTTGCRFRWQNATGSDSGQVDRTVQSDDNTPHQLQVLSLFAMQRHAQDNADNSVRLDGDWQIGLIRWVESRDNIFEAGGRIIGFSPTACGVRLETKDNRSQVFVPALLLSGSDKLGSKTTLLLPKFHFRMGDKIVLRIGTKQTLLKLSHVLINSDDFEQYDILKLQ